MNGKQQPIDLEFSTYAVALGGLLWKTHLAKHEKGCQDMLTRLSFIALMSELFLISLKREKMAKMKAEFER